MMIKKNLPDRYSVIPLLILAGFTLWFMYDIYTLKRSFIHTDFITYYYPFRQWFTQQLLKGDFPLWNPFMGIGTTSEIWATFPIDVYTVLEIIFGPKYHYFQVIQMVLILLTGYYVFTKLNFRPMISAAGIVLYFMTPWVTYFFFYFMKPHSFVANILLFYFFYQWFKSENYKYLLCILFVTVFSMFGTKPEFWFYQLTYYTFFSFMAGLIFRSDRSSQMKMTSLALLSMFTGVMVHAWQLNLLIRIMGNTSRIMDHSLLNLFSWEMYHNLLLSIKESPLLKMMTVSFLFYSGLERRKRFSWLYLLLGGMALVAFKLWNLPLVLSFIKSPVLIGSACGLLASVLISQKRDMTEHLKTGLLFMLFIYYWCRPGRGDLGELEVMRTAPAAFTALLSALVWLGCSQFSKSKLLKLAYFSILFFFIMREQGQIILAYLTGLLWIPTRDNYIIDFSVVIFAVTGLNALETYIMSAFKSLREGWRHYLAPISVISIAIIVFTASSNYYYSHVLMAEVPSNYPYYKGVPEARKVIQGLKDSDTTRLFFLPNDSISFTYDFGSSLLENVGQPTLYSSFVPVNYGEWSIFRRMGIRPEQKWGGYPNEYSEKTISTLPKKNTLGYSNTEIYLAHLIARPPIDNNTLKLLGVSEVIKFMPENEQGIRIGIRPFQDEVKGLDIRETITFEGFKYPHTTGILNGSLIVGRLSNPLSRAFCVTGVSEDKTDEFMHELNPILDDDNNTIKTTSYEFHLKPADIVKYQPEEVSVTVDIKEDAYLVLTDLHHPFWHARIDGQETVISPAFHIFRAVKVPSGKHDIYFYCEVPYFRTSIVISLALLFLSIGSFFFYSVFSKKNITKKGPTE